MTTILSLETSTEHASVSIMIANNIISRELDRQQTHSNTLLSAIDEVLQEANIQLNQCDYIAFGCGPGAFTGVRTACGVVQGLAFGAQIPVIAVNDLQALASAAKEKSTSSDAFDFVCVLDARMGEVYWGHYQYKNQAWQEMIEPQLGSFSQVATYLHSHQHATLVIVEAVQLFANEIENKMIVQAPHAMHIGLIALQNLHLSAPAHSAQPFYLRNKIALTTLERELERKNKAEL